MRKRMDYSPAKTITSSRMTTSPGVLRTTWIVDVDVSLEVAKGESRQWKWNSERMCYWMDMVQGVDPGRRAMKRMMKSFQNQGPSRHVQGGGHTMGGDWQLEFDFPEDFEVPRVGVQYGWMPNGGGVWWRENFSPRLPGKRGKCGSGGGCLKLGLGCLPQQRTFWIECADYWTYSLCSCLDQRTFQGGADADYWTYPK